MCARFSSAQFIVSKRFPTDDCMISIVFVIDVHLNLSEIVVLIKNCLEKDVSVQKISPDMIFPF